MIKKRVRVQEIALVKLFGNVNQKLSGVRDTSRHFLKKFQSAGEAVRLPFVIF